MAHELSLNKDAGKSQIYQELIPQIEHLIEGEDDIIANLANISAALKEAFAFLWVGFYIVKGEELVLGPFQGPVACTRISYGRGVCGTAWEEHRTIIVDDVEKFPGHIACSQQSKSEIVLPVFNGKDVVMVLDIDSDRIGSFDSEDEHHIQSLVRLIEKKLTS
jgi:GAF domain-containing protein